MPFPCLFQCNEKGARKTVDDLLYVFEETGEGCGKHPDPACLCDVSPLPAGVPIRKVPGLAPFPTIPGPAVNSFLVWGSMTLGRFEALAGINEAELNEALSLWEGRDGEGKTEHRRTSAAHRCLRAGLTFEQTARWLSTTVPVIMDLFYPRDRHELMLEMEKHIRAGRTAKQVAEATGCERNYAADVARRWNVTLPHSGVRYSPQIKAEARKLVESGLSRREVARRLELSETRVITWCKDLPGTYRKKESP